MPGSLQAVVEEQKHNIEGIEAFAWQPQTPARQRASSLSGACALLSKLGSHSSGSLLREGSQVCTGHLANVSTVHKCPLDGDSSEKVAPLLLFRECIAHFRATHPTIAIRYGTLYSVLTLSCPVQVLTPSFSAGQPSDVSTPRGSPQPGTPKWLSPISEVGSSPLQLGSQPSFAGELARAQQNAVSAEQASGLGAPPGSPPVKADQLESDYMTPKRPTATLEFPVAARDVFSTPTLLMPPAPPSSGLLAGCLPLKKLHSGKLQMSIKAATSPGPVHVDMGCLARQASADLKARHDLETKRLEMSAEGACDGGKAFACS